MEKDKDCFYKDIILSTVGCTNDKFNIKNYNSRLSLVSNTSKICVVSYSMSNDSCGRSINIYGFIITEFIFLIEREYKKCKHIFITAFSKCIYIPENCKIISVSVDIDNKCIKKLNDCLLIGFFTLLFKIKTSKKICPDDLNCCNDQLSNLDCSNTINIDLPCYNECDSNCDFYNKASDCHSSCTSNLQDNSKENYVTKDSIESIDNSFQMPHATGLQIASSAQNTINKESALTQHYIDNNSELSIPDYKIQNPINYNNQKPELRNDIYKYIATFQKNNRLQYK